MTLKVDDLLELTKRRQLPCYIVPMPMTAEGKDTSFTSYQVWEALTLDCLFESTDLNHAIHAWLLNYIELMEQE